MPSSAVATFSDCCTGGNWLTSLHYYYWLTSLDNFASLNHCTFLAVRLVYPIICPPPPLPPPPPIPPPPVKNNKKKKDFTILLIMHPERFLLLCNTVNCEKLYDKHPQTH